MIFHMTPVRDFPTEWPWRSYKSATSWVEFQNSSKSHEIHKTRSLLVVAFVEGGGDNNSSLCWVLGLYCNDFGATEKRSFQNNSGKPQLI